MAITNLREALDAEKKRSWRTFHRKVPSQITTAGIWFDMNMSPGNPKPFYYASPPGEAATMDASQGGIFHGGLVTPYKKYLRRMLLKSNSATGLPMPLILCDYLMYYPFIDMGETEDQPLINAFTLPRHTTGAGVQIMAVLVAAGAGGQTFRVTYTNSDGVAGRETIVTIMNTATAVGTIITSQTANASASGAFLPLQLGDSGVRSIESIRMISGPDVGLFTLVLVKPVVESCLLEQTAPVEKDYLAELGFMPELEDGAYLNFICLPKGSLSAVNIYSEFLFSWG